MTKTKQEKPLKEKPNQPKEKWELELYWHVHHDILVENLTEPIENRIKFIKENKPKDEIKLRLNPKKWAKQ